MVYPQWCSWSAAAVQICFLSIEGTYKINLAVPVCYLDLTQGAILSSDPKKNKLQKIVHSLKSVAGSMFNAFLSTKSKTHSILGQKEVKRPMEEEGRYRK